MGKEPECPAAVPDWVLTFGDMMSLLLCFFILLFGMSEMKKDEKSMAAVESIIKQFGDAETLQKFLLAKEFQKSGRKPGTSKDAKDIKNAPPRKKAEQGGRGAPGRRLRVQTIRDGNRIVIGGPVVFQVGEAQLTDEAKDALATIAAELRGKRHIIEVRGYDRPIELPPNSPFRDAADLAHSRLRSVATELAKEGIRPSIIRLAIAAPVELEGGPKLDTGEPMHERVDITTLESSVPDFTPN